jgi:hypothetical protein
VTRLTLRTRDPRDVFARCGCGWAGLARTRRASDVVEAYASLLGAEFLDPCVGCGDEDMSACRTWAEFGESLRQELRRRSWREVEGVLTPDTDEASFYQGTVALRSGSYVMQFPISLLEEAPSVSRVFDTYLVPKLREAPEPPVASCAVCTKVAPCLRERMLGETRHLSICERCGTEHPNRGGYSFNGGRGANLGDGHARAPKRGGAQ